jgi:hypothetical protein
MNNSGQAWARRWAIVGAALLCTQAAVAGGERAVVELFTSQGCSSCPPADAVAGRLRANPAVLVLSFHVNYWDGLGWRDPFASQASTDRQYAYARSLGERSVFTPQLIVNGTQSLVGSRESAIERAVETQNRSPLPVHVDLAKQLDGGFAVTLKGSAAGGEVWEIRYVQHAVTQIRGGENGGRTLETYNNVTGIRRLGTFACTTLGLRPLTAPDDGLAVIVQASGTGKVLGAAAYPVSLTPTASP